MQCHTDQEVAMRHLLAYPPPQSATDDSSSIKPSIQSHPETKEKETEEGLGKDQDGSSSVHHRDATCTS